MIIKSRRDTLPIPIRENKDSELKENDSPMQRQGRCIWSLRDGEIHTLTSPIRLNTDVKWKEVKERRKSGILSSGGDSSHIRRQRKRRKGKFENTTPRRLKLHGWHGCPLGSGPLAWLLVKEGVLPMTNNHTTQIQPFIFFYTGVGNRCGGDNNTWLSYH